MWGIQIMCLPRVELNRGVSNESIYHYNDSKLSITLTNIRILCGKSDNC